MEKKSLGVFLKRVLKGLVTIVLTIIVICVLIIILIRTAKYFQLKINNEHGIQKEYYADIGGIKQYIQIRGQNVANPIILVLHDGPGLPMSYYSYYWQTYLEEDYTIVHWDQRGCGRTYYANKNKDNSDISVELLVSDLDEIVDYLTEKLDQDKVVILGYSWGSVLGSMYVQEYPEKVTAYIGVSQVVNSIEAEKNSADEAAKIAQKNNNAIDRETILMMCDNISNGEYNASKFNELHSITSNFLPSGANMSDPYQIWMTITSPYFKLKDFKWYILPKINPEQYYDINYPLYEALYEDDGVNLYDMDMNYEVPVYFISGNRDWVTPYKMVRQYFDEITAPDKNMVLIGKVGHFIFLDNPREFASQIREMLEN